jgi:Carboxypeptidase regulatory-like domain
MNLNRIVSVRSGFALGAFVLLAGLCCPVLRAQMGQEGTVVVTVVDQSGGAVEGANLTLTDVSTNDARAQVTQQLGSASFSRIPLGTYRLTVAKSSFRNEVIDTVVVQGGRVTEIKVSLKVGSAVETVVVDATSVPLVETTSNAIVTTLDVKQIEDLPLQGRDVSSLAQLTPGYSGTPGGGTWNGLPVIAQSNTIDGVVSSTSRMKFSGNVQPGLEARLEDIQELTVQTSQVDLSQGMGMAAMQVNFVTRRGSNDYHGRVYEDFRNTVLNANSWTNNAEGLPRTPIILNNFGGSVGGHIIKDKLFFFASYSEAKQPGGFTTGAGVYPYFSTALTPLAQSGIFTDSNGNKINLFTIAAANGLPISNSAIAAQQALINTAIGTAGTAVTPSGDPNLNNINWFNSSPTTKYYPAFRVDYNATQKFRVDFSFEDTKYNQPNAASPYFPGSAFADQAASNKSTNYIGSLGLAWTITPTLINQFRGGYYYNAIFTAQGATPAWVTTPAVTWAYGSSGQTFNLPITTFYPTINFSDSATWVHNTHSITFGMDYYREQDHYYNAPDGIPNLAFGLAPGDPATNAFNTALAGESAGDRANAENLYATLVGRISSINPVGSGYPLDLKTGQYENTKPGASFNLDELQKGWGLYAQDSFHINQHLTFNYGLRWDFTGDDHDLTGAYHGAGPSQIYGPSMVNQSFSPGVLSSNLNPAYIASSHQYNGYYITPQPTVGLAWNPTYSDGILGKLFGGSNTVIRAGFDIKRFTEPYQYFWNNASNYGKAFFQSFNLQAANGGAPGTFTPGSLQYGGGLTGLPAPNTFPAAYAASLPQSLYTFNNYFGGAGFNPNIQQPYLQEWNLGVQRQIGTSNVLEVRYLGHRSLHQWISTNTNEVNIFENGFLKEFQNAQSNLKICMANAGCAANPSFGNIGLPGQVALPILSTAFGGATAGDFTNSSFITDLNQGAAGALAGALVYPNGNANYICNLVGSSLSPCDTSYGYTTPGPYPVNFFQANPYLDSYQGGAPASYMTAQGFGSYQALQVDFRQKQWHGMQFDVNYTWSHTLGIQPDNAWEGNVQVFTIRNLRQSYGPTTYDLRNVVHASGTYDLPFGHGKAVLNSTGPIDRIVGGWTVGTIFTHDSGFPFQLLGGYDTFNDYGDGGLVLNGVTRSQLQNAIGTFSAPGAFKYIFNPAFRGSPTSLCSSLLANVCQNTTAGTFGANPWLTGPSSWNADMSISKVIPISERFRFSLQAEFLNVFNHPNWANPGLAPSYLGSTNVQSSVFGQSGPSNLNSARQIELRANITF